jgi:hypothetical protein
MGRYRDPSSEKLANGRSLADVMPGRTRGIQGVIVAPSTKGGVPINYDPHDDANMTVTIDPDGDGKTVVNVRRCQPKTVNWAVGEAAKKFPGKDIDSQRERALYAFQLLAKAEDLPPPTPPAAEPVPAAIKEAADDEKSEIQLMAELEQEITRVPASPPIEQIDRGYSPMAAFGLKKRTGPGQPPTAAPATSKVGPPQKLVYFEKEGIGTVPAFFHDIIAAVSYTDDAGVEESGFMVLIYDTRFEQSAARWFPPSNDPYNRPWAAQINGENKLYLVHTTGFQYVYDSREYCILLVERAVNVREP